MPNISNRNPLASCVYTAVMLSVKKISSFAVGIGFISIFEPLVAKGMSVCFYYFDTFAHCGKKIGSGIVCRL